MQVQFQQERAKAERTRQLERLLGFQHEIQIETSRPASSVPAPARISAP